MFDENFSFLSATSTHPLVQDGTSTDISPFTSRCSSPRPQYHSPSIEEFRRRDSRFDSYRPRHPSIVELTAQLQTHALTTDDSFTQSPTAMTSSSDLSLDNDEGFFDGPDTSSVSDYSDTEPSLYDLSMADLIPTSSPRPSLSLEAQAHSSYTMRRRQRQALVRLQCLAKRAPDLAMLIEECHPSSLPLENTGSIWGSSHNSSGRSNSSGGRIEKESRRSASSHKLPKMRKRPTK